MSIKKGYFGNPKLTDERVLLLERNTSFIQEVNQIRISFSIPNLNFQQDTTVYPFRDTYLEDSTWLLKQPQNIQDKFINEVELLIKKYKLPVSFRDWIEKYILYGKPKDNPYVNYELVYELMNNPDELQRLPLSSQEKNMVKDLVRFRLGINKRPPKHLQKDYKELLNALSASKSNFRGSRTISTSIKTLGVGKIEKQKDVSKNRVINRRKTFKDLIPNIYSFEEESKMGPEKLSNRLRKQHQRLKQRMKKLLNTD